MSDSLTPEQREELKEAFEFFDRDGDGYITIKEMGTVMRSLGQNPSEAEIHDMLAEADLDGDGGIDYDEFVSMMSSKLKEVDVEEDLRAAFKVFDYEKNGYISVTNLRKIMSSMGERLTEEEVDYMIQEANPVNDFVNYEEFIKVIAS